MHHKQHSSCSFSRKSCAVLACASLFLCLSVSAHAQTFQVLHNFAGGSDGANPLDGLTIDRNGNLYGTASAGGNQVSGCINFLNTTGCGAVFELAHSGSGWILKPLYDFPSSSNGNPAWGAVFGPDGALYGPTNGGSCCGDISSAGAATNGLRQLHLQMARDRASYLYWPAGRSGIRPRRLRQRRKYVWCELRGRR